MQKLILFTVLALLVKSLWAQPAIRLKTRTLDIHRVRPSSRLMSAGHYILVFHSYPNREIRQQLAGRGIRVLQYVPENGLMVSAPNAAALAGLDTAGLNLAFVTRLEAADKIDPALAAVAGNQYLVIFHSDVSAAQARQLAQDAGFDVIEHPSLLPHQVLASGPFARLKDVAANDQVAYILRASADLVSGAPVIACPGAITEAGALGEYVVAERGWPRDVWGAVALQYVLQTLTEKVNANIARGEIERALREWARYANIRLTPGEAGGAARTIAIRFARGEHGDQHAFDGPGNTLAHTYYPSPVNPEPLAGDIHMDADESWTTGSYVDLYSVVLHEVGHALGLGHSSDPNAVMYPYYRQIATLAADDIAGIQSLYGAPVGPALPPPTEAPVLPPEPEEPPVTPNLPPPDPTVPSDPPTAPTAPSLPPPVTPPATPANPVPAPANDTAAPSLRITNPGGTIVSTSSPSIGLVGTSSDNVAVVAVKWASSTGTAGNASGLMSWSAQVPLLVGANVITVRAFDAAGNSAWRAVTVVRR